MEIDTDRIDPSLKVGLAITAGAAIFCAIMAIRSLRQMPPQMAKLEQVKVTSYNTMANAYSNPEFTDWYNHIDPKLMDWGARQDALIGKIKSFNSDVICLQEVEPELFKKLQEQLSAMGFEGIYTQKLNHPEGSAIFWNTDKLQLESHTDLFFNVSDAKGSAPWRPAQVCTFKHGERELNVINTHLAWDVNGDLATKQLQQLVDEAITPNTILCGDFNIEPHTPGINLLQQNGMNYAAIGREANTVSVHQGEYVEKVDYIFHTVGDFRAKVHPLPKLKPGAYLPAPGQPSDHLPITATLTWQTIQGM